MKIMHLSDLHLGKMVNEYSMIDDQKYILNEILHIAKDQKPDVIIMAGDIYDRSVPPAEAVQLLDDFLTELSASHFPVLIISGNHDSAERVSFGSRLMESSGIHIAPVYNGTVEPITMEDEYGPVHFYLLPFVKPAHVRRYYPDDEIKDYTDAMRCAISHMTLDPQQRNIMVTHQFVGGAQRSDSEDLSVGGTDNVDPSVFDSFDYVALGHLHGPQSAGRETIRYCGTPLKYSFSELTHQKSVTLIEMKEKGNISLNTIPLIPLHDMKEIRGTFNELTDPSYYTSLDRKDYYHVFLTDEQDIPNAMNRLRVIYENIMLLDYDNLRTRTNNKIEKISEIEKKSPLDIFEEFYKLQNGQSFNEQQKEIIQTMMEEIWEDKK